MSTVFFDISMSLDGFMTAAKQRPEEPMGEGGLQWVQWAFGDDPALRGLGTVLNVVAIAVGASIGTLLGGRLPERLRDTLVAAAR